SFISLAMSYLYLAFFMGLFGSVHCAVMCGPLLLAVNGRSSWSWKQVFNRVFYQVGRILTYGFLGLMLGALGSAATVQGGQRALSMLVGVILVTIGLLHIFGKD